ncbi:MAG: DnaD domain protein [Acetatifactor sp.]|nr:DnaD domain protein [Acetatifactor sp.]
MTPLTIYKDSDIDSTVVANLFIDEYMKDANDAQLKIYLYLLRMMSAHQATSVSDIADKFNYTEKDIVRALKYWEKMHLMDLDYNEDKVLIGIHIRDLADADSVRRRRRTAPSTFIPMPSAPMEAAEAADAAPVYPKAAARQGVVPSFEKKTYSPSELREFKNQENIAQLIFVASTYIGKPLSTSEINSILFFVDVLHFSDSLVDYLIEYCADKGKKDFKYIEKVAISWAEKGITTPEEAKQNSYLYEKAYYAIMKELGKSSAPTPKEAEYITRWIHEYGYSNDIIFEACARTVLATDKNRFEYCERILQSWHEKEVHHLTDVARMDEQFKKKKGSSAKAQPQSGRFGQFSQNTYDFDALEQSLISNSN